MRVIPRTGIGAEKRKQLAVPVVSRALNTLATISSQYADSTVSADLPVGSYTYQGFQIAITSKVDIVGKTVLKGGKYYVQTAFLADYIDTVELEINSTVERKFDMATLLQLNTFFGHDQIDGFANMVFGGPGIFWEKGAEDAYMLGTKNVRQLRLLFKLKSAWIDGQLNIEILSEHARQAKNLEFITTMKTYRKALGLAGEHQITDLPISADLSRVYLFPSAPVGEVEFTIDDQVVLGGHSEQLKALNGLYGRDMAALGSDAIVFDFWRTKEVNKGLRALKGDDQRARNADIRVKLETLSDNVEVKIIMELCGAYWTQG